MNSPDMWMNILKNRKKPQISYTEWRKYIMQCDICGNKIGSDQYEIRGGLGNKHICNMCPKCYDRYVRYSTEQISKNELNQAMNTMKEVKERIG